MKKISIHNSEILKNIGLKEEVFPKYTTSLLNIANRFSQGTRPKVVGQMSDLIQIFEGETYEDWVTWYQANYPDAINNATKKIYKMILNLKEAIAEIDEEMVRKWVADLTLTKTYVGLRFQETILKTIAGSKELPYRLASPADEAKGIDGFIGTQPVSIKPITYKTMDMIEDNIGIQIIYYDKRYDGIHVEYEPF
ncbi:MAG: MjaI family restriction endonuclease [Firmicutes bacterium]|nr:MjaI family restriction endonuclease [Bacillota bacterium]